MAVKSLSSWKIKSTQTFLPLGIRCIGDDQKNRAIITYAAHTVNTFIFRNFSEDVKDDKAAHKSYLHKSFFPERIKDITVGTNESAILLESGRIKYFTSPKKLMTAEYLSCVKSICSIRNGFVLIKTTSDGSEFFVEFHPDAFQDNEPEIKSRPKFNITFDKILELQNTWNQSYFKLKELTFNSDENQFLQTILPEEACTVNKSNEILLFLSIDNTFCSIHVINEEYSINPIVICTAQIVDFWSSKNGNYIILLLEGGVIEILYLSSGETSISRRNVYLGSIEAYEMIDDVFMWSDNNNVKYGTFMLNEVDDEFEFNRKTIRIPGILALTYLPEFQLILCVSENCGFYSIPVQMKRPDAEHWIEIDRDMQTYISNLKYQLLELTDVYDNLLDQQLKQHQIQSVIELKRNEMIAMDDGSNEFHHHFTAVCSVTQTPNQQYYDSFTNTLHISNSLIYDRGSSFFVSINICYTVMYANEFDANLWNLCCRWLNDKNENICANIKIDKCQLSSSFPLTLIIHLQQKHLPNFFVDVSTNVRSGNRSTLLNFPAQVEQPDYCEMMSISTVVPTSAEIDEKSLTCTVLVPNSILLDEIFKDRITLGCRSGTTTLQRDDVQKVYEVFLLDKTMSAIHYPQNGTIRLTTKDVDLMYAFKKYLHRKIEKKLSFENSDQEVKLSTDALKEYIVSKINLVVKFECPSSMAYLSRNLFLSYSFPL